MNKIFFSASFFIGVFVLILITGQSCRQSENRNETTDSLSIRKKFSSSPVLSPQESMKKMHVEKGFAVKLVAS